MPSFPQQHPAEAPGPMVWLQRPDIKVPKHSRDSHALQKQSPCPSWLCVFNHRNLSTKQCRLETRKFSPNTVYNLEILRGVNREIKFSHHPDVTWAHSSLISFKKIKKHGFSFFKKRFYLFTFRERGGKKERNITV